MLFRGSIVSPTYQRCWSYIARTPQSARVIFGGRLNVSLLGMNGHSDITSTERFLLAYGVGFGLSFRRRSSNSDTTKNHLPSASGFCFALESSCCYTLLMPTRYNRKPTRRKKSTAKKTSTASNKGRSMLKRAKPRTKTSIGRTTKATKTGTRTNRKTTRRKRSR